jgi:hypothetical protein
MGCLIDGHFVLFRLFVSLIFCQVVDDVSSPVTVTDCSHTIVGIMLMCEYDMYLDMFVCPCFWTAYLFLFFHLSI